MPATAASSNLQAGGYGTPGTFEVPHRLPIPRLTRNSTGTRPAPTPEVPADVARPGPRAPVSVSICIPAYNEERNIVNLLAFLRAHPAPNAVVQEVLVDVSGSTDGTRGIVSRWSDVWPAVRMVDVGARDGLLKAVDRMIHLARGDVVIRIDADVRLGADTLEHLVTALESSEVGIASPRVTPERSRSYLADLATQAEWEIHHQVSLGAPKTTLVQAFRKLPIRLPADSGLEDAGLQDQIEALGYKARYVPSATVSVLPPSTIRGMLLQRIRTIQHIRTHVQRGYPVPPTASPRVVGVALVSVLRDRNVSRRGILVFAAVEVLARVAAFGMIFHRRDHSFNWEPVEGTKDIDWSSASP